MITPRYLYGMHDSGGEHLFADKPGWIVITEAIGHDPNDTSGRDYTQWSDRGYGIIVRLNNAYGSGGTIPLPQHYDAFALRVANFIAASDGCDRWIIGNEPNMAPERPSGMHITPQMYVDCFRRVHDRVRIVAGYEHHLIPAPVAVWNIDTGDWLDYQVAVWRGVENFANGVAIHTYTHGASPELITSNATMDAPYQDRLYNFRAYRDFMEHIPAGMRGRPVYITETDQNDPWVDANTGWVRQAYAEIDRWNKVDGTQKIHCLCLYRWPDEIKRGTGSDKWGIEFKNGVHEDMRAAVAQGFLAPGDTPMENEMGNKIFIPSLNKESPSAALPPREWDTRLDQRGIELTEYNPQPGEVYMRIVKGEYWEEKEHTFAETLDKGGARLPGVTMRFWWGSGNPDQDNIKTTELKPGDRWMVDFPMYNAGKSYGLKALGYPSDEVWGMGLGSVEQPDWNIHVSYKFTFQLTTAPSTQTPSEPSPAMPPVGIIVPTLSHPIPTNVRYVVTSSFGDGHRGIDYAVVTGTPIGAVDGGQVMESGFDEKGYGEYVKLRHAWGESVYAHLSRRKAQFGEHVNRGNIIGSSGSTGNSTGPHLHFAMRVYPYNRADGNDGFSDPAPYLSGMPAPAPTPTNANIPQLIKDAAQEFAVDWRLLSSQAWAESSFDPRAVSGAGAQGIMQIMPGTWAEWSLKINAGSDAFDARQNTRVGAAYMQWLIGSLGGEWNALAAYGWGIGNLLDEKPIPDVWANYANKIIHGRDLLKAMGA